MGVLGTLFGGIYYAASGPSKPIAAANTPPLNASSSDEADFIKCVTSSLLDDATWANRHRVGSSSRSRTAERSIKRQFEDGKCLSSVYDACTYRGKGRNRSYSLIVLLPLPTSSSFQLAIEPGSKHNI